MSMTPAAQHQDTPGLRPNRACRNCVQIKVKCIPREGSEGSICQRCYRLQKECVTPAMVSRRKQRDRPTRVAQLEEKVSALSDLITQAHQSHGTAGHLSLLPTFPVASNTPNPSQSPSTNVSNASNVPSPMDPQQMATVGPSISGSKVLVPTQQELLFAAYRTNLSQNFPFVVIPPDVTAAVYQVDKPLTFRCCITVASHRNTELGTQMVAETFQYLADHVIINGEKTLDLLQGLILIIGWAQFFDPKGQRSMRLLHLALALLADLNLNRPQNLNLPPAQTGRTYCELMDGTAESRARTTSEEARALLACYHLSLMLSFSYSFWRLDYHLRWTEYMDAASKQLQSAFGATSDAVVIELGRLHHIMERYLSMDGVRPSKSFPVRLYVSCFQNELQRFRQDLPPNLSTHNVLNIQLIGTEICLYGSVIAAECDIPREKVEALHNCLARIAALIDYFVSLPPDYLPNLPYIGWVHLGHALEVLAQLSFLNLEGWDLEYVRTTNNIWVVADRVVAKLDQIQEYEQRQYPEVVHNRYSTYSAKIHQFQKWYESKVAAEDSQMQYQTRAGDNIDFAAGSCGTLSGSTVSGLTDAGWQDFVADWNFYW